MSKFKFEDLDCLCEHSTEYRLKDKECREAVIRYNGYKFLECNYKLPNTTYNLDDWKFLGKVSRFIVKIESEILRGKNGNK